jgi:thiol-disulfide isomerase/thioredoxin
MCLPPTRRSARSRAAARRASLLLPAGLLGLAGGLAGCSSLPSTGDTGFVTSDGTVRLVPAAERGRTIELSGKDLEGRALDLADFRGKPTVVVVWGSWCAPCRAEAPDVVAAARQLGDTARFVGIDLRNAGTADALAFQRHFELPYRSLFSPDGEAMLSFSGTLGPRTIPAFVVLDGQGRVAGSIIGSLPSTETLVDLVGDVAGHSSAAAPSSAASGSAAGSTGGAAAPGSSHG